MKRNKKFWDWKPKHKRKKTSHYNICYRDAPPNWFCDMQNRHLEIRNAKNIFDEDYLHPVRTGKGIGKWNWW